MLCKSAQASLSLREIPGQSCHREFPFILKNQAQIIPEVILEIITRLVLKMPGIVPASCNWLHQQAEEDCAVITPLHKERYGYSKEDPNAGCLTPELW